MRYLLIVLSSLALASCSSIQISNQTTLTLRTDSAKINCVDGSSGIILGRDCFKVYRLPDNTYYDVFSTSTVGNFVYEEGYEWTILVKVSKKSNPPADSSSLNYTLVRIIDKIPKP